MIRVSIITPIKNGMPYVVECLTSTLSQTHPVEHIFVDGGSTDGTWEYLQKMQEIHPAQIKLLRSNSERGLGIGGAWNEGIAAATGEIIGWLGSDDGLSDNTVIGFVESYFEKNKQVCFLHGDALLYDSSSLTIGYHQAGEASTYTLCNIMNNISCPAAFYKKVVCTEIGGVDEYGNDLDLFIKISKKHRLTPINRPLAFFRIHEKSITGNKRTYLHALQEDIRIVSGHGAKYFNAYRFNFWYQKILMLMPVSLRSLVSKIVRKSAVSKLVKIISG